MRKIYLSISICCLKFINVFAQTPCSAPMITANDATICAGQPVLLTASGADTYVWSNGVTGNHLIVNPVATTTYTVTGTNVGGCTGIAVGTVMVFQQPRAGFSASPNPTPIGTGTITFTNQSSPDVNYWFWYFGDGDSLAPIAASPRHVYPVYCVNTSYTVTLIVHNAGNCYDTISHSVVTSPGLSVGNGGICLTAVSQLEENNNTFAVYPNPTSGLINIETQGEKAQIKITDLLGNSVYQSSSTSSNFQIDLSSQVNGVYFVQLKTEQGTINKKILISQ